MNDGKRLINNTLVLGIGSILSRVISVGLVTLYTYTLTTTEYATVDLLVQSVNLLLPVVGMGMSDAVFRFIMDKKNNDDQVLSNAISVISVSYTLFLIIYFIFSFFIKTYDFFLYVPIILIVQLINLVIKNMTKAKGFLKLYAFGGILNSILLIVFNFVWLYIFKLGPDGYFISMIVSYSFESIVTLILSHQKIKIKLLSLNFSLLKRMLNYGFPLIPNTMMWWIVSMSDRYIINYCVGLSVAGIYAVAHKIPTIINTIVDIFSQAWQISAIESNADNKSSNDNFQSLILNRLLLILFFAINSLILILKPLYSVFVSKDYYSGWIVIPVLLASIVFQTIQMYFGTNYVVHKKNWNALFSSSIGAILNIIISFLLTLSIGMMGAAIGTMVSYLVIAIIRYIDTKKYVHIKFDLYIIIVSCIAFMSMVTILYVSNNYLSIYSLVIYLIYIILISTKIIPLIKDIVINKTKRI